MFLLFVICFFVLFSSFVIARAVRLVAIFRFSIFCRPPPLRSSPYLRGTNFSFLFSAPKLGEVAVRPVGSVRFPSFVIARAVRLVAIFRFCFSRFLALARVGGSQPSSTRRFRLFDALNRQILPIPEHFLGRRGVFLIY